MDRRTARAQAMKLVYEWEMGGDGGEETRLGLLEVAPDENEAAFMNLIAEGVQQKSAELDAAIAPHLKGWTVERLSRVDLAILRVAAYELLHTETAAGVIVSEAVELANQYSTDKAGGFVNGVLGSLARQVREGL